MPGNPVLPLIPWSGGLNIRNSPTLAHHSKLVQADDIVYDFDGTKLKRGGQAHRNRIPIPGGKLDDHFTKEPPGDWTASDLTLPITLENDTEWRGTLESVGSVSVTRTLVGKFNATYTARVRVKTADLVTTGSFFELIVDPGTGSGLYRLGAKFLSGDGIQLEFSDGVYTAISSSNGTMHEFNLSPGGGSELYEIDQFHTWRFDMTSTHQIKIYFDELLIFTSNAITTLGENGDNGKVTLRWSSANRLDVSIDYISVQDGEESIVTALADYPRIADGIISPTQHRMVAAVNGRVYVDVGDHLFRMILDNYMGVPTTVNPRTAIDFASFHGYIIIARGNGSRLFKWDGSSTFALEIVDSPLATMTRVHKDRLWVAGDARNPSRIYFSGYLNEEVWTVEDSGDFLDSGFIDIDPEDGGIISGIGPSFHDELIVYKTTGIYRIVGDDFDTFDMNVITKALGGNCHHAIQNVGNDQYFVSQFGVHSLLTTEKFGDLEEAFLSHDIRDLWNENVNPEFLHFAWAYNNEPKDRYELLISIGIDQDDTGIFPNRVLCLSYGVKDETHPAGRWSVKEIGGGSGVMYTDESGIPTRRGFVGDDLGFVNRQDEIFHHDFPVYKAVPGEQGDM